MWKILADYGGDSANELQEKLHDFFTGPVMSWLLWGVAGILIVKVAICGLKMALAKSPEERNNEKTTLLYCVIGALIAFGAGFAVPVLIEMILNIWS